MSRAMTKKEFITEVVARTRCTPAEGERYYDAMCGIIADNILNCRGTTLWGVGTITAKERPGRTVTMGMWNGPVEVPPRITAGFKVARLFSAELRQSGDGD
jgi:nucleoid DNA-binding protein